MAIWIPLVVAGAGLVGSGLGFLSSSGEQDLQQQQLNQQQQYLEQQQQLALQQLEAERIRQEKLQIYLMYGGVFVAFIIILIMFNYAL